MVQPQKWLVRDQAPSSVCRSFRFLENIDQCKWRSIEAFVLAFKYNQSHFIRSLEGLCMCVCQGVCSRWVIKSGNVRSGSGGGGRVPSCCCTVDLQCHSKAKWCFPDLCKTEATRPYVTSSKQCLAVHLSPVVVCWAPPCYLPDRCLGLTRLGW